MIGGRGESAGGFACRHQRQSCLACALDGWSPDSDEEPETRMVLPGLLSGSLANHVLISAVPPREGASEAVR